MSKQRIFKIGSTRIAADETTAHLSNEQARDVLKRAFPEVAHATIRETGKAELIAPAGEERWQLTELGEEALDLDAA